MKCGNYLTSLDTLYAMFDGGYMKKEAEDIKILNRSWGVFSLLMRFIYTRIVDVMLDI